MPQAIWPQFFVFITWHYILQMIDSQMLNKCCMHAGTMTENREGALCDLSGTFTSAYIYTHYSVL